jgi:hypothetical protein
VAEVQADHAQLQDFRPAGDCGDKLVGIVTNRDLRFVSDDNLRVNDVMTSKNLVTAPVGIDLEHSKALLHEHRIEKLLVVDDKGHLKGLITIKDIEKIKQYPNAAKDSMGRLLAGAALGVGAKCWNEPKRWSRPRSMWSCLIPPTATPPAFSGRCGKSKAHGPTCR